MTQEVRKYKITTEAEEAQIKAAKKLTKKRKRADKKQNKLQVLRATLGQDAYKKEKAEAKS